MAAKLLLIHELAERKQLEAFHIKLESSNESMALRLETLFPFIKLSYVKNIFNGSGFLRFLFTFALSFMILLVLKCSTARRPAPAADSNIDIYTEISFKINATMIKMYVMHTCPDCEYVEKQVVNNPNFEVIDIGKHVRNLKQFIKLRDTNPAFDEAKAVDDLGIPCYVLEDGTVTLYSKDVGLEPRPQEEGPACSIDGRGC